MAKRKTFKRVVSRTGGYTKSFVLGYHSTAKSRINTLSRNALKSKISKIKSAQGKSRRLAIQVNKKLQTLNKWGHYNTWASRQLLNRLDNEKYGKFFIKDRQINIDNIKYFNKTQLTNLNKAMNQFINSKSSTIQGINAIQRNKRKDIARKVNSLFANSLTNKEIEDLYRVFDTDEFKTLTEYNDISSDDIYESMLDSMEQNWTTEDFINDLAKYIDKDTMNDEDVLESLSSIHEKIIKR